MKRPNSVWLLVATLIFLAFGGLYGGITMLVDPSGKILQMDDVLQSLPVPNYVLPGLFLTIVMGIFPILLVYGLVKQPDWLWADSIAGWSKHDWSWTGSVALGAGLLLWLFIQGIMIGFRWPIQYVTLGNGLLILMIAFLPRVRKHFRQ